MSRDYSPIIENNRQWLGTRCGGYCDKNKMVFPPNLPRHLALCLSLYTAFFNHCVCLCCTLPTFLMVSLLFFFFFFLSLSLCLSLLPTVYVSHGLSVFLSSSAFLYLYVILSCTLSISAFFSLHHFSLIFLVSFYPSFLCQFLSLCFLRLSHRLSSFISLFSFFSVSRYRPRPHSHSLSLSLRSYSFSISLLHYVLHIKLYIIFFNYRFPLSLFDICIFSGIFGVFFFFLVCSSFLFLFD